MIKPKQLRMRHKENTSAQLYLEVFITEEGELLFSNVTRDTIPVLNELGGQAFTDEDLYCG